MNYLGVWIFFFLFFWGTEALAKQYEIFDGRHYNGKYYPRIDVIEWGEPAHLEFHIYSKEKPVEISSKTIERGGRKVLLVSYLLKSRGERVCRSVLAPANFQKDKELFYYKDKSDSDYDNIFVSSIPLDGKKNLAKYSPESYRECEPGNIIVSQNENESKGGARRPASVSNNETANEGSLYNKDKKSEAQKSLVDYENSAIPFQF